MTRVHQHVRTDVQHAQHVAWNTITVLVMVKGHAIETTVECTATIMTGRLQEKKVTANANLISLALLVEISRVTGGS